MSRDGMTRRWREIDSLFEQALDIRPELRDSFLARACKGDDELRAAIERLLRADSSSRHFLDEPFAEAVELPWTDIFSETVDAAAPAEPDRIGDLVGPYRLLREVGRGGMATVYLAERADGEWEQQVAVKIVRRGLDTDDVVRRFLAERQILSSLRHPHIARLLDGGTTEDGLPFLVMEFVSGIPITEYCDTRTLSIEQRLKLFCDVGLAVQYAHRNLVVHRDLKPSNILVDQEGKPKLLDFGIAKLLDPAAEVPHTRTGVQLLTPEYASPEQLRGDPVTTASDVYQLGVILCELLAGRRPYSVRAGSPSQMEALIVEAEPTAPSALADAEAARKRGLARERIARRLRGDLDTIVLTAIRKEPERRYSSADGLVRDVMRYLEDRPILARRESPMYRVRKFLTRHAWVAPAATATVLLIGAYVVTLIRHGNQLEEERNVARDVQQAFVSFFTAPDSGETGLGEGRRDLTILKAIQDGTDRVRNDLADRPAARAELFGAMATVLQDLDEPVQALELASEALELERALYGDESPQVHETLLMVGRLSPNADSARAILERQLELSRTLYGPTEPQTATSLHALAELDLREGKLEDAVHRLEAGIDIYRTARSVHPRRLAEALAELADNLEPLNRTDEAVTAAREGYDILVREFGERHSQSATAGARLAQALTAAGRYNEARSLYESSLAAMDVEMGATHATTMSSRNNYAILLRLMGDAAAAEAIYRQLLEAQRERYGAVDAEIAASLQNLAVTVKDQGRYDEAESLSRAAYEMFGETRGSGFFQTAFPLLTISEIRLIQEDYSGAEAVSREALELLRAALPPGHFATAIAECRVGQSLAGQGRTADARPFLEAGADALRAAERPEVNAYRDACVATLDAL